jgi:hypothetical protein
MCSVPEAIVSRIASSAVTNEGDGSSKEAPSVGATSDADGDGVDTHPATTAKVISRAQRRMSMALLEAVA